MSRLVAALTLLVLAAGPAHAQPAAPPWQKLWSPDPTVRATAAEELAASPSFEAHGWLVRMLREDPDPRVRIAAARAIARTRNEALKTALSWSATGDPDPGVREAARVAGDQLWAATVSPSSAFTRALLPGLGHFYLRRPGEATAYLVGTLGLLGGGIALAANEPRGGSIGEPQDPALDADDPIALLLMTGGQNLWFYSMFDAYRSARLLRGNDGYLFNVSRESLGELAAAPFRPSVVSSPWVWAGLPVMVGLAVGLSALVDDLDGGPSLFDADRRDVNFLGRRVSRPAGFALGEGYFGALFVPVGLGEEALFRGALQPMFTESLGQWPGWAMTSLLFGAVHIMNFADQGEGGSFDTRSALIAVPFITVVGSYLGVVSMRADNQLSRSVALHFWYDFLISTAGFIADPDHQPFVARFGMPF